MASGAYASSAIPAGSRRPLSSEELRKMHAYWRAANYLSVGQIYLLMNPLLREPLKLEHIKPRLLGHWGTTPGLNFIYLHFNRLIKQLGSERDLHRGPRTRRTGLGGEHLSGRHVQRVLFSYSAEQKKACEGCSSNSLSREAFLATLLPRRQARFTKAANWAIRLRMPMAPPSTIQIFSFAALLAMENRKQGRSQRAGIRTNS